MATHGEHIAPGAQGVLALRPEQVRIAKTIAVDRADNHFRGTVKALLYRGEVTLYTVELEAGGGSRRCCRTPRAAAPRGSSGRKRRGRLAADAGHFLTD